MRLPLAFLAVAGLVQVSAGALTDQGVEASELIARIQARYDKTADFRGEFVQTYEGGLLRTRTTESGNLAVKRPGRMRWVYTRPEWKEFVSDGARLYSYIVEDRQVIVSPLPAPGEATTPALFLTGQANLARDFEASLADLPGAPAGLRQLKLVPRSPDPDYEWFGVGVDAATLQIRYLVAADRQGGRSTFTFSNLSENTGLSDTFFEFRVPRGVDVVNSGTRSPR
jgi:outer membrane lipoprotein carrier protein